MISRLVKPIRSDQESSEWNVSVVAWGAPDAPTTFSGYSSYLVRALESRRALRRQFSAKQLVPLDALRGALTCDFHRGRFSVSVRRSWMWSERGYALLSKRLNREIARSDDRGAFLQVGTLVGVDPAYGPHFVLTDMTIPQAYRAGYFSISQLSKRAVNVAIQVQQRVLTAARHVFTLSEWTRQSIIDDFGIDASRVTVVYAGANLQDADGASVKRRPYEVLFVGIDWERKGGPLLIEAFRRLRRQLPQATLRIVGCSPDIAEPGVKIEGYLDRRNPGHYDRLVRCYRDASCFCLPSLFDPFPNAVIEASSMGLPTVAIRNGSRAEAVLHRQTGVLAEQPSPECLADALAEVLTDTDRCRSFGQAAREFAAQHFTWDHVVRRIETAVAPYCRGHGLASH